jgi:cell division protein FtsQ
MGVRKDLRTLSGIPMRNWKRLLRPLGIVATILVTLVMLGFVEHSAGRMTITSLDVRVNGAEGIHFIDEEVLRREVLDQGTAVMGASIREIDLPEIEDRLRNIPSVAHAEVYHTMDGMLHVKVRQREPIVRVFDRDGSSFYIDRDGYTMPVQPNHTARVLVVTGAIRDRGAVEGVRSVYENDSLMRASRADDIHRLALFIRDDPFWSALIDQVVVTPEGEFELVPKVGSQRVLLGDGSAMEQRFNKLRTFYEKGIPRADWRRYARIDLRFADQIVCTKRTTP